MSLSNNALSHGCETQSWHNTRKGFDLLRLGWMAPPKAISYFSTSGFSASGHDIAGQMVQQMSGTVESNRLRIRYVETG